MNISRETMSEGILILC